MTNYQLLQQTKSWGSGRHRRALAGNSSRAGSTGTTQNRSARTWMPAGDGIPQQAAECPL